MEIQPQEKFQQSPCPPPTTMLLLAMLLRLRIREVAVVAGPSPQLRCTSLSFSSGEVPTASVSKPPLNVPLTMLLVTELVIVLEDISKIPSLSWLPLALCCDQIIPTSQGHLDRALDTQPLLEFAHKPAGFLSETALQQSMGR